MNIYYILLGIIWFSIGVVYSINDWTKDCDLKIEHVPLLIVVGLFGPIYIFFHLSIKYISESKILDKTLISKRKK